MHGRKLALNEVNKEKHFHITFNRVQLYEKMSIYHNFSDTEVEVLRYISEFISISISCHLQP